MPYPSRLAMRGGLTTLLLSNLITMIGFVGYVRFASMHMSSRGLPISNYGEHRSMIANSA
jgi:hypothetical protein